MQVSMYREFCFLDCRMHILFLFKFNFCYKYYARVLYMCILKYLNVDF